MKVGLLIIASEVLNGKIKDLNTHFLSDYLRINHLELSLQLTVNDNKKEIHEALDYILSKCELVVTSGGVGPTKDDITKESIASYLGRSIQYSPEAERVAGDNYIRMVRPFPGKDHVYSHLPEGFIPLANPSGFAPGYFIEHQGKFIFSGPGVPREFRSMVQTHFPLLVFPKVSGHSLLDLVVIRTRKIPEEKIFGEVDAELWNKLSVYGEVSSLPVVYGVDIGVKITAGSQKELTQKRSGVMEVIKASPIHSSVWHIGNDPLEEVLVKKAGELKLKFTFAESATGGLCSERVTNVPGVSQCFLGSIVCYDASVKENILHVPKKTIEDHGVVSVETAEAMAFGAAKLLGADIGISITGLAGPGGGTPETPVGTVCIGRSIKGKCESKRYEFKGDRELLKMRFSQIALMTLLETLEDLAQD